MSIRILLADDHVVVRQGLKSLIERHGFVVVGEAGDGQEVLRQAESLRPDIVIMDISMPVFNGLDASQELRRAFPKIKTILLTQHNENQYVAKALEVGVKGYVLKSQAASELIDAIQKVMQNHVYLSPGVSRAIVESYGRGSPQSGDRLTLRERQVLQLIAEGKSTRELASILGISVKTAESHRTRLMQKLDIHETASLVLYAVRYGLVQP